MIEKISLANLPTKIEKIDFMSKLFEKEIYIKRDDQTGVELSGNKVRKLEYAVKEALDLGCNCLITCGGIQSNHARATAAAAARLGLECHLVLRDQGERRLEGNTFLEQLLGAKIHYLSEAAYQKKDAYMNALVDTLEAEGIKGYILPTGASNGIGTMGYIEAYHEISLQDEFDAIVVTVGSGGTYSGLFLGSQIKKDETDVIGINIAGSAEYFKGEISRICYETNDYIKAPFDPENIHIIDGYAGDGYAISRQDELEFIKYFARETGIILDPVYTGKAMYGFFKELQAKRLPYKKLLFIHTGGIYGLFSKAALFNLD